MNTDRKVSRNPCEAFQLVSGTRIESPQEHSYVLIPETFGCICFDAISLTMSQFGRDSSVHDKIKLQKILLCTLGSTLAQIFTQI
jgi:hypothetical protein